MSTTNDIRSQTYTYAIQTMDNEAHTFTITAVLNSKYRYLHHLPTEEKTHLQTVKSEKQIQCMCEHNII